MRTALLWCAVVCALLGPVVFVLVAATSTPAPPLPLVRQDVPDMVAEPAPAPPDYGPWAARIADVTGIPARAVLAYAHTEVRLAAELPACGLDWATLAGIGSVESDHGRIGGRVLGADGHPSAPVLGVPLDGTPGVAAIRDTDGGALDGDAEWDRAVGPMQFIPGTWRAWAADGDGDGTADPHDVDDAALAAGRYLCAVAPLSTSDGWRAAVLSYNASDAYLHSVLSAANDYAVRSRHA